MTQEIHGQQCRRNDEESAVQARYDRASLKLLERVGVNLNQVVRHMHREEFDGEIMESFRRILKTLEEILDP